MNKRINWALETSRSIRRLVVFLPVLMLSFTVFGQVPVLTSFAPASAPAGSTVIITGTNFGSVLANTTVYFGASKGDIISVSPASIAVKVPLGASYAPLSVTVSGLTGFSNAFFNLSASGSTPLAPGYMTQTDVLAPENFTDSSPPIHADIDGDGKPDLVIILYRNGNAGLYVYRNISSGSTLAFAPRQLIVSGNFEPIEISAIDVDGDSKLDIVISVGANNKSICRNTSEPGSISFQTFAIGSLSRVLRVTDIDGDGKPDLVLPGSSSTLSVSLNNGSPGTIAFGSVANINITVPSGYADFLFHDLNNDGKQDLIVPSPTKVSVFRNTSTIGIPSFEAATEYPVPAIKLASADFDIDGKPDLLSLSSNTVTFLKNESTSTGGVIALSIVPGFTTSTATSVSVGDIKLDGKPDIILSHSGAVAVVGNTSTPGTISFAAPGVFFAASGGSTAVSDLDGDGRPDISYYLSFLLNKPSAPPVSSFTSFTPARAAGGATVTIKGTFDRSMMNAPIVKFGGVLSPQATFVDGSTISAVVGAGASGTVSVTNYAGELSLPGFTYIPPPVISSFSPAKAIIGDVLTIDGTDFTNVKTVLIGSYSLAFTLVSATRITVAITSALPQNTISVSTDGGTSTVSGFRVIPIPVMTSFSPASASTGTTVTIFGTGFTEGQSVRFGGTPASFEVRSDTEIRAVVGIGSSGNIEVSTYGGKVSKAGFTYVPTPVITAAGSTTFPLGKNVVLSANTGSAYAYKWFRDGSEIAGATSSTYTASESGLYKVALISGNVTTTSADIRVTSVFVLPASNFKVLSTAESCMTSNNGSVSITAEQNYNYVARINGGNLRDVDYKFTKNAEINNLAASTYSVCITVEGQAEFKQCFDLVINEPKDLSLYTSINNPERILRLFMDGGDVYRIQLNGLEYTTSAPTLSLPLVRGINKLKVSTDRDCQGIVEKQIELSNEVILFPNPVEQILSINLAQATSKLIAIAITNTVGKVVYQKKLINAEGVVQADLSALDAGIYFVNLSVDNVISSYKIIKK